MLDDAIATAPGDLPMPEVAARFASLRWQFRHDNTLTPNAPRAQEPVEVTAMSGADVHLQHAVLYYTTDGTTPSEYAHPVPMQIQDIEWDARAGFITRWSATIPGKPAGTLVRYRIGGWGTKEPVTPTSIPEVWASDGQGFWFRYQGVDGITTFAYSPESGDRPFPEWMSTAVVYHIFLDRFHPGTPGGVFSGDNDARSRHGGTLEGVRQAIPYLADLGVNCLWLSPLGPSETYHRYDTIDYFGIDPELGTPEDLRHLIGDAHRCGMRVWLDFVPVHSSWHHPAFVAAQKDRSAPSYSWYTFDQWPDSYRNFMQSSRYLPSLNTDDPGARRHLIDAAVHWLREFDVDGYRLDHAIAASMDFWLALRTATEAVKEDVVLVGEATDTPDCLRRYRGRLHGILDFPLARALRQTFAVDAWGVEGLETFLGAYERYMADGPGTVSFLDNHDMDRFLWVAGNDIRRLKMAAICQFTLAATPVVYYGTEIGMTQEQSASQMGFGGDAEARRNMIWEQTSWDHDVLSFYRALIRLRREEPTMQGGSRRMVHLDGERKTYAYLRIQEGAYGSDGFVVAFNLGQLKEHVHIPLGANISGAHCVLSSGNNPDITYAADGLDLELAPMTASIVRVSKQP